MLPNFLIIGAQKCGTTSLYYYLLKHPFIFGPLGKEMHFFTAERYNKGLSWYQSHFDLDRLLIPQELQRYFVTGEASPDYIFHPHVPRRIKKTLPT